MARLGQFKSISTNGDGNCAFHAIFGEYNQSKKEFFCENVAQKRMEIAELIIQKYQEGQDERLIEIINNAVFEIFSPNSKELKQNPGKKSLYELIDAEKEAKEKKIADEIQRLLTEAQLHEKISQIVANENITLSTGKEPSTINLYLLLYNKFNSKEEISQKINELEATETPNDEIIQRNTEILNKCYDLQQNLTRELNDSSQIMKAKFEEDPNLQELVLESIKQVISQEGKWLPQQLIPAIARVSKKIISVLPPKGRKEKEEPENAIEKVYETANQENNEEDVRIYFKPGHFERVMPIDWEPTLKPSIVLPKQEENVIEELPRKIIKYFKILSSNNIEIIPIKKSKVPTKSTEDSAKSTKGYTDKKISIKNGETSKDLGVLKSNSIEFNVFSAENHFEKPENPENNVTFIDEQQSLFISFLKSMTDGSDKQDKILTFQANNFSPESLQKVLSIIQENHKELLKKIKITLPPFEQCIYISSITDGNHSSKKYTNQEYQNINNSLNTMFSFANSPKKPKC